MIALDNNGKEYTIVKDRDTYTVRNSDIQAGCEYIDFVSELFTAETGEEGYFLIAHANHVGTRLVRFKEREDSERVFWQKLMPVLGVKNSKGCFLIIAEGYKSELNVAYGVKKGKYYLHPRFIIQEPSGVPYESPSIKVIKLDDDADYSDMAVKYREYKLERNDCVPLLEKMKHRPKLAYAASAPEIRIRMGWKPAPPTVLEQTIENEPEMHVACTFDRVCDLIDELKSRGVDKAEICLVGWNVSGHDGRWPDAFPVEEKLGGEKALRHLINYAQENGFQIVCHTNSTDCYNIADTFSKDIVAKTATGELSKNDVPWSGGTMYHLCPTKSVEYANRDLPKVSDLGFRGLHYIDVISLVPLRWCFDEKHPVTPTESLEYYNNIMEQCRDLFGGFASEGGFDFCVKNLDYALYVNYPKNEDYLLDEQIPFWKIAYHGIALYNTSTETVNYGIKGNHNRLKLYETAGRPLIYLYSKFVNTDNGNWMGGEDLVISTDEELKFTAQKIAESYNDYRVFSHLQTEFIVKHRELSDGVFETTYSNGEKIITDYNSGEVKLIKNT